MVTKGRYQTKESKTASAPLRFRVIDTDKSTLGERFMCATDTMQKADTIAVALNFNYKPSDYGYEQVI